jgi:glycine/D-amino acid oxidase-like deaminating enzyme
VADSRTADVVIVGAGVIGASAAWHLATRGVRRVRVIDRAGHPAAGSTGAATGGFRAQFATSINVRLSLLSRDKLKRFGDEVGADPGYVPAGYLWIAETPDELAALRAGRAVQHEAGLHEAIELHPDDVPRVQPAIARAGIAGAAFCPSDGFIKPRAILDGYLAAATRLGVDISWGEPVTGFDVDESGRVRAVRTASSAVSCGAVVNAAGAWAAAVAQHAGLTLPVVPLRRHLAPTVPTRVIPPDAPMTLYCGDGFHFRERDGRLLMGWPTPGRDGAPFDTGVDAGTLDGIEARKNLKIVAAREVPLDRSAAWTGLYEMSPDKHAILGPAPKCPNFYFVNGSSGHGVMHAPALGALLAEIITEGQAVSLDAAPLAPDRFTSGRRLPSSEVL